MSNMYAKQYAQTRDHPYATVCRWCREGKIPSHKIGKKFWIDSDKADRALEAEEYTEKYTPKQRQQVVIQQSRQTIPVSAGKFNFLEELKKAR